jgi:hypothetical protein
MSANRQHQSLRNDLGRSHSLRKSFDVNRNLLSAVGPAMNESSQNDSAEQAQKRPEKLP